MSSMERGRASKQAAESIKAMVRREEHGKTLLLDDRLRFCDLRSVTRALNLQPGGTFFAVHVQDSHADDADGAAIAELIRTSDTIKRVDMRNNHFSEKTFDALGHALSVNSSVEVITLSPDLSGASGAIRNALMFALRFGPPRSVKSDWRVAFPDNHVLHYVYRNRNLYPELKEAVERLPHPTMLELLVYRHEPSLAPRRRLL